MKTKLLSTIAALACCIALHAQETPVEHAQLPAEAKTFIKEHFKSAVHHAVKDVERNTV